MLGFFILLFFFFSDIISVYKVLPLFSFHLFLFGTRFSPRFALSFSKVLSFSVPQVYFLSSFLSSLSLFSLFFFVVVVVVLLICNICLGGGNSPKTLIPCNISVRNNFYIWVFVTKQHHRVLLAQNDTKLVLYGKASVVCVCAADMVTSTLLQ